MLVKSLVLALALVATSYAGVLDGNFVKSFSSDGEKKDAILEFSPVLQSILSNPAVTKLSGDERRTKIVSLMKSSTKAMQLPVLTSLKALGVGDDKVTPFWIANKVAVAGVDKNLLTAMSAIPGPFSVREAGTASTFPVTRGEAFDSATHKRQAGMNQWGVDKINAAKAWAITRGINSTVGVIDTGARVTHEALRGNFRGGSDSWHDAVNGRNDAPYDDNGHGTHCMGTIVGQTNGIGVAPDAKWIACKALNVNGSAGESQLTECGQWMACPDSGTCLRYPNLVSNSWGGGIDQKWFNSIVDSWTALNMVPLFAIGNSGQSGCGSANSPGDQPGLISVGSTDRDDGLSYFSSRGPGGPLLSRFKPLFNSGKPVKPEVAAPGGEIVSADYRSDTGYQTMSGTSMATPHTAGAAALVLSANKDLGWEQVKDILESTAVPGDSSNIKKCPFSLFSRPPTDPDNQFGHGRIDAYEAVVAAQNQ